MMHDAIARVEAALTDLRQGKMIILTDAPDRENEGDVIFPAEIITPDVINFMIRHGSGIVCLSLDTAQLKKLDLNFMVPPHENESQRETPFMVSIEAKNGITTGVSAHDRATTILTAVSDQVSATDIVKPGHIFPLKAKEGGVLERAGHTEGSLDLVRLAGFKSAAVLCELMNADGTMMCGEQLNTFAKEQQIKMLSIEELITYRLSKENLIIEETSASLPIESFGMFTITAIKEKIHYREHVFLNKDRKNNDKPMLVRIHSSCLTGDVFGSRRCDCNYQLNYSLSRIGEEGGMLIYLNQEGRGIGLFNKIKTYSLQENGLDTVQANEQLGMPADSRQYYIAANILRNHGVNHIRLLTNNPSKISDLKCYGELRVEQEKMPIFCNEYNRSYLTAKRNKLNHMIDENLLLRCS